MDENQKKIILEEIALFTHIIGINREVWLHPFKYDRDVFSVMISFRKFYNITSVCNGFNNSKIATIKTILDDFDNYYKIKKTFNDDNT